MSKIHKPLELAARAAEEYRACYGETLQSVTVYGSAAGGDFDPERSDVNLLVVLDKTTLETVEKSAAIQNKWLKQRVARPIFMDREYLNRSLDSFPIEFFNMQQCYTVLVGEDVLGDLEITRRDLRLQAERELKGKWLHLMQDWLAVKDHRKRLQGLLQASLGDFTALFRALVHVRRHPVPQDRKALWEAVTQVYELQENPFGKVHTAALRGDKRKMREVFVEYVRTIEILIEKIDQVPREEEP